MATEFSQANRLLSLRTPIGNGTDVLLISDFTATERISRPFVVDIRAMAHVANADQVSAEALIGQEATVSVALPNGGRRRFSGIVVQLTEGDFDNEAHYYQIQLVPWVTLLTLTSCCRIFQDSVVPDIVMRIFEEKSLGKFARGQMRPDYTVRDYTTQYRETDFNFISRLLEDEGIYYFFEHGDGADSELGDHTLIMTDLLIAAASCPGQALATFAPNAQFGGSSDCITSWQGTRSLRPGGVRLRDYHFELSRKILEVDEFGSSRAGTDHGLQIYDYAGSWAEKFNHTGRRLNAIADEGQRIARIRMEEEDSSGIAINGTSYCRAFLPGYKFSLSGHSSATDGEYVLSAVKHTATQTPSYRSNELTSMPYYNSFSCIPLDINYRPPRVTRKPIVQGLQTAVVASHDNKSETEISCDKYGRVHVIFHWDARYDAGRNDTSPDPSMSSSAWIRVSQIWAGKGFGAFFLPRVGDEVLVSFLEGDPDRPVIVGSLYNDSHPTPYTLPANQTQSGIKTHSSPGGSASQFNELRFEDAAGKEEVTLHAERALTVGVEGSESRSIGGARTTTIANAGKSPAPVADELTIKQGDRKTTVTKGNDVVVVTMGDHTYTITQGGETHTITAGDFKVAALAGTAKVEAQKVEISGLVQVKISCGASSITLTPASIEIKAPLVTIN